MKGAPKEKPGAATVRALAGIEQLISVKILAARLDVSPDTIYAEMDGGRLPYYRIGKTRRIAQSDAAAYVASRRVGRPITPKS